VKFSAIFFVFVGLLSLLFLFSLLNIMRMLKSAIKLRSLWKLWQAWVLVAALTGFYTHFRFLHIKPTEYFWFFVVLVKKKTSSSSRKFKFCGGTRHISCFFLAWNCVLLHTVMMIRWYISSVRFGWINKGVCYMLICAMWYETNSVCAFAQTKDTYTIYIHSK
jgi:hypothetical protein